MLYVVLNKKTKEILHIQPTALNQKLKGKDVYPDFNPKTMQLAKTDLQRLPDHFNVNKKGFIVEKTFEEKILEGIIGFDELFRFEGASGDPGFDKVKFVLDNKLIKTVAQCKAVFAYLDAEFEAKVAREYRPGLEAKLMKDYMAWLEQGKPADDKREKKYLDMKAAIDAIKEEYKEVRAKLKKIIVPLKKKAASKKKTAK